jgi:hypothetical protein
MTIQQIKKLFPKKVHITQEMIDAGSLGIGLLALKSFTPEYLHEDIFWGLSIDFIKGVKLKTERWDSEYKMFVPFYLNEIKEPTIITFEIRNDKQ